MARQGKIELALSTDTEIATLARQHNNCTLPYENWTHRAHIAVALYYLQSMSLEDATRKLRVNIHAYNTVKGDGMGYSETITVLFMKKIAYELQQRESKPGIVDELERLLDICTIEWVYNYYSPQLIWSQQARQEWVEPDLKPLDF